MKRVKRQKAIAGAAIAGIGAGVSLLGNLFSSWFGSNQQKKQLKMQEEQNNLQRNSQTAINLANSFNQQIDNIDDYYRDKFSLKCGGRVKAAGGVDLSPLFNGIASGLGGLGNGVFQSSVGVNSTAIPSGFFSTPRLKKPGYLQNDTNVFAGGGSINVDDIIKNLILNTRRK